MIDGSCWKLTTILENDTFFQSEGENGQPDKFFEFVANFEKLINKNIGYNSEINN